MIVGGVFDLEFVEGSDISDLNDQTVLDRKSKADREPVDRRSPSP